MAVELLAQRLALAVGHHGEVEVDVAHPGKRLHRPADAVLDLVAQRAAGDGEGDQHLHVAVRADLDVADHAQLDDRAVQLRVFHGAERFDDLICGGHGAVSRSSVGGPGELPLRP
jgi:hypothetical protein